MLMAGKPASNEIATREEPVVINVPPASAEDGSGAIRAIPELVTALSQELGTLETGAARLIVRLKNVLPPPILNTEWVNDAAPAHKPRAIGSPLAQDLQVAIERVACVYATLERVSAALQI